MDKISEFFSDLKERISNPFIISYLIGWCVWNYEIIIGLVFYKTADLKLDGYISYLDLIHKHSSTWHFLWLPLISALTYTFIFPFIKNIILAFGVWIDRWGGNWNLDISKTKNVSSERYLEYKIKYDKALEDISKYANEEKSFMASLEELQKSKDTLTEAFDGYKADARLKEQDASRNITQLSKELKQWEIDNSKSALNGTWYFKVTTGQKIVNNKTADISNSYIAAIFEGNVTLTSDNNEKISMKITSVICNYSEMIISFQKESSFDEVADIFWKFAMHGRKDKDVLGGVDNVGNKIRLTRKVETLPAIAEGQLLEE